MASFVKFYTFVESLCHKGHDFSSDTLKFALTNTAPTQATDTVFTPGSLHPPPAAANGYTSGGHAATISSHAQSGGVFTLGCTTDVEITATAGGIGPFRYVILYNDTSATDLLIGYWDYGSEITLASGEKFTIDVTASLFTLT